MACFPYNKGESPVYQPICNRVQKCNGQAYIIAKKALINQLANSTRLLFSLFTSIPFSFPVRELETWHLDFTDKLHNMEYAAKILGLALYRNGLLDCNLVHLSQITHRNVNNNTVQELM